MDCMNEQVRYLLAQMDCILEDYLLIWHKTWGKLLWDYAHVSDSHSIYISLGLANGM